MKRVTAVMGAAAMVLWASAASAQAKPDFSGSWTLDAEKTAAANPAQGGGGGGGGGRAGGRGGMGGGPMTIKLDASALTVERQGRGGAQSTVYKLDGSEQTVTMGQMGDAKVKATWEGNTIVIETTRQGENGAMTTKQIYSMEDGYLVVSQTLPPRGGGEATTRKSYYKKG